MIGFIVGILVGFLFGFIVCTVLIGNKDEE